MRILFSVICAILLSHPAIAQIDMSPLAHTSQHGYLEVFNAALDAQMVPAEAKQLAKQAGRPAVVRQSLREDTLLVKASRRDAYDGGAWTGEDSIILSYDANHDITETLQLTFDGFFWAPQARLRASYSAPHQQDSLILEYFDGLDWIPQTRNISGFDAQGQEIERIYELYSDGVWKPQSREQYTFATNGEIASWQHEVYDGSWKIEYRYLYTYHPDHAELSLRIYQVYDMGAFENKSRQLYDYDPAANMLKSESQIWNGGAWEGVWKNEFTYNAQNLETQMIRSNFTGTDYEFSFRENHTYDAQNRVTLILDYDWIGVWALDDRETYTYNGQTITSIRSEWINLSWENELRQIAIQHAPGLFKDVITQHWINGNWENQFHQIRDYGSQDELLFEQRESWKDGFWEPSRRDFYYWTRSQTTANNPLIEAGWRMGPNPAQESVHLYLETPQSSLLNWMLMDLQGRVIAQHQLAPGTTQYIWQRPDGLPTGLYLSIIRTGDHFIQQKLYLR